MSAPPHDLEAERIVLGAMMLGREAAAEVFDVISVADFYTDAHRSIAAGVLKLLGNEAAPTDPVAVWSLVSSNGARDQLEGGAAYLHVCYAAVDTLPAALYHARAVAELAQRRMLLETTARAQEALRDGSSADEVLVRLRAELELAPTASRSPQDDARAVPGGVFALDSPTDTMSVWGRSDEILWATEEPLLIVSPTGVGKTTLAQRLLLARIGIAEPAVLGYPVAQATERILYIAADRPRQARKSLRRMVTPSDRPLLDERLVVWKGPLPFDLASEPARLARWTQGFGARTLMIDSIKDVVSHTSKEEIAAAFAQAQQYLVAEGIEVVGLHHQRKAQAENRKPKSIDDVYGSTFFTAVAGSVLLLWGKPGDPEIELSQLKMPESEVGPFMIEIDHVHGTIERIAGDDLLEQVREADNGLSAQEAARLLFDSDERSAVVKTRRRLDKLTADGLIHRIEARKKVGGRPAEPARYHPISRQTAPPNVDRSLFG